MEFQEVQAAAEIFKSLAHPLRLKVVLLLAEGEASVTELAQQLEVSQPAMSQHLRILSHSRVLHPVRKQRQVFYQLCDQHIAHIAKDAIAHSVPEHHEH